VAEAAVVGITDEVRGETVKAFVVLQLGETVDEAEIRRFCREHMADYKMPRLVAFVRSLPHTADGAVDKKALVSANQTGVA